MEMMSNSDNEAMSDVPHPFVILPAPLQAAQAAASDFLLCSMEGAEAISALVKLPLAVMASILLANIPVNNLMDRQETNKIFEAFDYVKARIQHRAKHQGVYFCNGNVKLPEETFIHVLGFLDKRDLIDNVSHVSYAWAKASLSPNVRRWQTIVRSSSGLDKFYKRDILQTLQRPQFTLLKKLFTGLELEDSFVEKIAQVSHRLEELGEFQDDVIFFSTETLRKLPTLFPKLNIISVRMERSSSTQEVICLVKTLGIRLVELRANANGYLELGFTDDNFVIIGRHCPNLRSFSYYTSDYYAPSHSLITERGLAALVEGCPKLEKLKLDGTCRHLDPEAFGYIALNAKNLCFLDVSNNWDNWGDGKDDWTARDKAIQKYLAKRLTRSGKFVYPFQYRLLPLP